MPIRALLFLANGQLTAARNAIQDSVLDPRGGGLDSFSRELRRVGGGGPSWWGASWTMERAGLDTVSFEAFEVDIIDGLNMKHNTGGNDVQVATYILEDDFPGMRPRAAFAAAMADTVKKPWAFERAVSVER